MTDDVVIDLSEDWEFHQASGIVSVQLGSSDVAGAGHRLIAMAGQRGESVHATSLLVIDHQLRFSDSDVPAGTAEPDTDVRVLGEVRSEINALLERRQAGPLGHDDLQRYTALGRREVELLHPD